MGAWQYIFIGLGIVLLVVTCRQQYTRRNKKYILLRLTASILAVAALICLALNINYTRTVIAQNEAIILTGGYNKDSVNLFTETANKKIPAYSFNAFTASGNTHYKTLHVFGYGLSADELQQLHNTPVVFHRQTMGAGITAANWKQHLQTGEKLSVQGSFNNTGNTPVILQLNGLNTLLDSVSIPANTLQTFQLGTVPKQAGKAVYSLTALTNNKVIEEEFLPVEVTPAGPLKILILASSPGFENRFLKNWLSENNCEVVVRSTTSKDKFDKAFLNTAATNIDRVTTTALKDFDIVISDATGFAGLSKDEQATVQAAVADGMGLIVKADTTLSSLFYASSYPVYTAPEKPQQTITVYLAGGDVLHDLPAAQSTFIHLQPGIQALVTDSAQQVLAGSGVYGQGKVAVTTVNNTYSWVLAGNKDSYYAYWSALLNRVAKQKTGGQNISFSPATAMVNQPLHITVSSNIQPQPVINGSPVYFAQNAVLPFDWDGTYWPVQTGWQTIKLQNDSTSFYVYSAGDWKYVTGINNTNATQQYVTAQQKMPQADDTNITEDVPVPKIYFAVVFLVCCTFLWVEKKI